MIDIVTTLKHQARRLQQSAQQGDPSALDRLGVSHQHGAPDIKRRHCLTTIAREHGFDGWSHLCRVLDGATEGDFGTLLYGRDCSSHWNIWSASYEEARAIREQHGGYLLPYKRQFLIVDQHFIETLGLSPDDPDWLLTGRDWVQTKNVEARRRLYGKLIRARAARA